MISHCIRISVAALAATLTSAAPYAGSIEHAGTFSQYEDDRSDVLRPFSVADSIEMTELAEPRTSYDPYIPARFRFSPDGRWFVVTTRRGDLESGENEYRLLLFNVDEVRRFVNSEKREINGLHTTVALFRTNSSQRAIEQVQWLDNENVAFIGRAGSDVGQIYTINISTPIPSQLTSHPGGVIAYDYSVGSDVAIYTAQVVPDWIDRNSHGYVVGNVDVNNLVTLDPRSTPYQDMGHFLQKPNTRIGHELDVPPLSTMRALGSMPSPAKIAISPNARWAVILGGVRRVPTTWAGYSPARSYLNELTSSCSVACSSGDEEAALNQLVSQEATGPKAYWLQQYYLVDMDSGEAFPMMDAPSGAAGEATRLVWSHDSARVLITPTFVTPTILDNHPEKNESRGSLQWAVVVEVPSLRISRVTDRNVRAIAHAEWVSDDIVVEWETSPEASVTRRRFRKQGAEWKQQSTVPERKLQILLSVNEDVNTAPDVEAEDPRTGRRKLITNLNPQFDRLAMGRVEVLQWRDRLGRAYTGGLVYPPSYRSGAQYPVVLQTNGFYPQEFLVDGPEGMSTAYAARAIAGRDMLVLQMPKLSQASQRSGPVTEWRYQEDGENPRFFAMFESAIDALHDRGLIDPSRVGMIGFSREGMHVQYAVTFSKYPIAAATIAHSIQATPFSYYLIGNGENLRGTLSYERESFIGAPLWGDGVNKWLERSTAFHLDRIRTPLRFEHLGTNIPEYWDTYTMLRRQGRPVEMIHIPLATHQIEQPFARYTSQEGNVDWFAFWLRGQESQEPSKVGQYERWRALRRLKVCDSCETQPR